MIPTYKAQMNEALRGHTDAGRRARGRELLDDGQVADIMVAFERVEASVHGSRPKPYQVIIRIPAGTDAMLTGRRFRYSCTCPDWGDPCKHGVAVALAAASEFDRDDSLVRTLLGLDELSVEFTEHQHEVLAEIRAATTPPRVAPDVPPPTERPSWAQDVPDAREPVGVEPWLGAEAPRQSPLPPFKEAPAELLLSLGPLRATPDGPDLGPALQLLLYRLTESE